MSETGFVMISNSGRLPKCGLSWHLHECPLLLCVAAHHDVIQALLAVRPELPDADVWRRRVQQVHETWAHKLYTRDRDITPGELEAVRPEMLVGQNVLILQY